MGAKVLNHDIAGLNNRINRFIEELVKAVSSGTSQTNEFDQARLTTYLDAIDGYHAWVLAQPHLDLPETHPREIDLGDNPATPHVENEETNDMVRILAIARDELINAQSARDASGLSKFDSARLKAVTDKVRAFLTTYIKVITPLDLPESSPDAVSSGTGRVGI
jgi:hypothetical protein